MQALVPSLKVLLLSMKTSFRALLLSGFCYEILIASFGNHHAYCFSTPSLSQYLFFELLLFFLDRVSALVKIFLFVIFLFTSWDWSLKVNVINTVAICSLEMVAPEVDKKILEELEAMGFPTARATRALHYSGDVIYCHIYICLSDVRIPCHRASLRLIMLFLASVSSYWL